MDALQSARNRLNETLQSISTELYRSTSQKSPNGAGNGHPNGSGGADRREGDVIDAEVVDEQSKR